jgi:hypothetical protein
MRQWNQGYHAQEPGVIYLPSLTRKPVSRRNEAPAGFLSTFRYREMVVMAEEMGSRLHAHDARSVHVRPPRRRAAYGTCQHTR